MEELHRNHLIEMFQENMKKMYEAEGAIEWVFDKVKTILKNKCENDYSKKIITGKNGQLYKYYGVGVYLHFASDLNNLSNNPEVHIQLHFLADRSTLTKEEKYRWTKALRNHSRYECDSLSEWENKEKKPLYLVVSYSLSLIKIIEENFSLIIPKTVNEIKKSK